MPARPAPLLLLACLTAGPTVPPAAWAAEPVQLFDGTTFTGWNGDTANTWRIEDGALVAGSPDAKAPRNEFLATDRAFGDFELRLEFRLDAAANGNAGVQFRTARIPDHHEVVGYQADIGPGFDGSLYDESRRKRMLVAPPQDVVQRALAAARDGWHDYLIRCTGSRIRLVLNGVETVDYTETDPTIPRSGVVALQIHGGMRGTVRYRNIRIEEFPPLLATDFRRSAADEGWQPSAPPDAFVGDVVRLALDPDEHGVRIVRGSILSPPVPVEPFAYYRVQLLARGEAGGHCAAVFHDAAGAELVADDYDAIDAAPDWRPYELCTRGLQGATTMRFRLQGNYNRSPAPPLEVKNVRIERIEPAEAAAWAARLAAACPVVRFTPAADRWEFLPQTRRRLTAGERLRVVMLGDSICNDTSNSLFETLLAKAYPRARIEIVTSVRGGTGCGYYKDENRVRPYVLDHAPDLVIIAGISHDFDVGAIRDVIRQIRAGSKCELLVMSGAVAPCSVIEPAFLARTPAAVALDRMERFPEDLARMCREERVQYLDMRRAWDDYMLESYEPFGHFARDTIHANSRGKAVLGRILGRALAPQADAGRP